MNLNDKYKIIGNAVPVNLTYVMAESILEDLRNLVQKFVHQRQKNSSFYTAERAWNTLTDSEKAKYKMSALAGVNTI